MEAVDTLEGEYKDDDGETKSRFNQWNDLFDFTKREDGVLNYTIQAPEDFEIKKPAEELTDKDFGDGEADWIFELPVEYGGTLVSGDKGKDKLQTFDIKIGAAKA